VHVQQSRPCARAAYVEALQAGIHVSLVWSATADSYTKQRCLLYCPTAGRPPVPDTAMECEQTGGSKGLPSVKHQLPGPGQSKRGLQATLSQSFQPDTPEHPKDDLLHSISATSMRSTSSGIEPQTSPGTNTQDASQPESALATSAQPASTNQQLHQQQSEPSAATEGAKVLDMLPEHSLAAQMSSEAPASSLQQQSQPAANTQKVELADDTMPEHSLAAQMSSELPTPSAQHQPELSAQPSLPAASDDMLPEHSLAAQMSNADQVLSLGKREAIDMLPEHSLVAQMSIDEPQPDAGEEDSVASGTTQLPHVLTTIESGNTHADHGDKRLCHLWQGPLECSSVLFHASAIYSYI